jgi:hypothetical protein
VRPQVNSHSPETRAAEFRFYEELNDFLPAERRKRLFSYRFRGTPSVKDAIQAIGVPHSAVDLILVDDEPVGFAHRLRGDERVAVYPAFERLDIGPVSRLRPRPLRRTRFVLDVHLGKLARYLRMLGFDSAYARDWDDARIIDLALDQRRIILTRDRGMLKHSRVTHGYWLRSHRPLEQVREVLEAFDLFRQTRPFTRCMDCNGRIARVAEQRIRDRVDARILRRFDAFWQCRDCGKIYWQGSHYQRMLQRVESLGPAGTPAAGRD